MSRDREWIIAPANPERERLAREACVPDLVAQILLNRGVDSPDAVQTFLNPQLKDLLPPESLPNAVAAAARLAEAVRNGRRIVIYGDYDVDGVTATAILWHVLRLAGANVDYFIPHRIDDGYGLSCEALEAVAAKGADLVITVDCGVTACGAAQRARELGVELIVTDHHEARGELPRALLVHPTALRERCPNPHLSGAGVALKVAWAVARECVGAQRVTPEFRDFLMDATAFAALGLIADVVPLTGENRIITAFGLRHLVRTRNAGLCALIEGSGLSHRRSFDDYDVGFTLAPRLNAVGRMGDAVLAVELFTQAGPQRAAEIAHILNEHNRDRRQRERQIVQQAEAMVIERGYHRDGCRGIVLASEDWHAGVIGVVAARIVERFGRPTMLIALGNGEGHGSGRSIRHFPLHEVLGSCAEHLVSHGGHAMAAGVRIDPQRIDAFTQAFLAEAARRLTPADLTPRLRLDAQVHLEQIVPEVVEHVERLAPFGIGNPRPRLATSDVEIADAPRTVGGNGQHLTFRVRQGRAYRRAIAFNRGPEREKLADHRRLQIAFEPMINEWNGRRRTELRVIGWRPAG